MDVPEESAMSFPRAVSAVRAPQGAFWHKIRLNLVQRGTDIAPRNGLDYIGTLSLSIRTLHVFTANAPCGKCLSVRYANTPRPTYKRQYAIQEQIIRNSDTIL